MAVQNTKRYAAVALLLALVAGACSGTERMKKELSDYGKIDGEWEIRDDANKKTLTYVMVRTKSGLYETYEIAATDGQHAVDREQVGGIDGTGCYITTYGLTSAWIMGKPPETLQNTTKSGDNTRTRCLEYKDTAGWNFIPAKDRKAAEPPPPKPKPTPPATGPDAGTSAPDMGSPGEVKSALPL